MGSKVEQTYLFIGGAADGEWIATRGELLHMFQSKVVPMVHADGEAIAGSAIEQYRRMEWLAAGEVYTVYALAGMTPGEVMNKLIVGYHKCSTT